MNLAGRGISVVLLDIEGTTTPLAFVQDVLFPFARAHLRGWLVRHQHSAEFVEIARRLEHEHAEDRRRGEPVPERAIGGDRLDAVGRYVLWLMDRDRKSGALKDLQALIWEEGYRSGELSGRVFSDVATALPRWHAGGLTVAIYSSGSVPAQRRLFASSQHGDLTPFIAAYFDTAAGAKRDVTSYARIASTLGCDPSHVLFVSDVTAELSAARAAGCQVALSIRPGNPVQPGAAEFEQVTSFDVIV